MKLNSNKKAHFIGIGGIGVSALARYYLKKGWEVSGSDLACSEITKSLRKMGAEILIGPHKGKNIRIRPGLNKVIYSPAIKKDNPELKEAKKLKIKTQSYPQALGELTKNYFTIAVCGTHGKSTTTALVGLLLEKAGLDPTVIVGTKVREFQNSNCRLGRGKYLVIEADEHFASFLNYWPKVIILTSLEADHLDYYKNFNNYFSAFKKFISRLPKDGVLIINRNDKKARKLAEEKKGTKKIFYSLRQRKVEEIKKVLKIPGKHNLSNALAVWALARLLKIPEKTFIKALSRYKGSWRRFEIIKGELNKKVFTVVSDYAHHPTELLATLRAGRERFPKKTIYCLFQPHQFQRTFYLFHYFVDVFDKALKEKLADKIIVTDIYEVAGRESGKIKKKVSSEKLVRTISKKEIVYLPQEKIINFLNKIIKGGEVLIIMGAGDIYKIILKLTKRKKDA